MSRLARDNALRESQKINLKLSPLINVPKAQRYTLSLTPIQQRARELVTLLKRWKNLFPSLTSSFSLFGSLHPAMRVTQPGKLGLRSFAPLLITAFFEPTCLTSRAARAYKDTWFREYSRYLHTHMYLRKDGQRLIWLNMRALSAKVALVYLRLRRRQRNGRCRTYARHSRTVDPVAYRRIHVRKCAAYTCI